MSFSPVFGTCECIARQLPGCDFCAVGSLRRSDSQTVRQSDRPNVIKMAAEQSKSKCQGTKNTFYFDTRRHFFLVLPIATETVMGPFIVVEFTNGSYKTNYHQLHILVKCMP